MTFRDDPPRKPAGIVLLLVVALLVTLVYLQFRGALTPTTQLTVMSGRSGLVLDRGAKVTYNGVVIGRVGDITAIERDGTTQARLIAEVGTRYLPVIPANVRADIEASTIFGNKYLSLSAPRQPVAQRISPADVIDATSVTTEFQTLFETVTGIAQKIDPVKLNLTLSALADSLTGLGGRFGRSLADGNEILGDANARMPRLQELLSRLADSADVYTAAGPDLWDALDNASTTAATVTAQQDHLDAALLSAAGFADTATGVLDRGGPYLIRAAEDLRPSAALLNTYSPELFCTIRNVGELVPQALSAFGGNGYSLAARSSLVLAPNPYVYPDNLPRINARGGPGGAPGCWQKIDRNFWPAPYLVSDTGASIAPYNHLEFGQPLATEYVWGRQIGENTINP